jgi:nicotinate-nucleotide pyrophosphorylase (carboxylating)
VRGTGVVVRDTRKTVPGMRRLAKYAVRTGGGVNHRIRLDDALLVKDNHLVLGGGDLVEAVRRARAAHPALPLEVEVRTVDELRAALDAKPDLVLLDNMSVDEVQAAVTLVAGRLPLEASGGITLATLPAYAATGVDYVAMGVLTHSAPAADLSLKLEPVP